MEEAGESRGGRGSYIDKMRNRHTPLPPPIGMDSDTNSEIIF
jgi:hypothetical protein